MRISQYDLKLEYDSLREEILSAVDAACQRASFVLGEDVEEFEKEFATYCGTKHCVALNSGTSALHLALLAVGVQPGDEVITTPNTFIATTEAISYTGAKPVFVDIDPATANLDPRLIEQNIRPATKALLPVHLYGRPADMDPIREIARRYKLAVIEDACQAHGAHYRGHSVGSIGDVAAFSFYPSKNLGAYGEGGAITTNDDRIAQFARAARHHGQSDRYKHAFIGYNYRMEGFQGAVLRVKMRHLSEWTAKRLAIAQEYRRLLGAGRMEIPQDDSRDQCAYHQFVVYVRERNSVRARLESRGIGTAIHYPLPLHLQPAHASLGYPRGTFPHAERACERVLSLPLYPALLMEHVHEVAEAFLEIVGRV
ncbi:MAG: DegT/DnrJ/EryC1/StrS family aminotransferase [Candidatus Acidiferrales bacterium]